MSAYAETVDLDGLGARLTADFLDIADRAQAGVTRDHLRAVSCPAPHRPTPLPKGFSAVYVFFHGDRCLKVGKAYAKSGARFQSHHYSTTRAPSTLARSLVERGPASGIAGLTDQNVGPWMLQHTSRLNFLLSARCSPSALALLEAFVQCRLNPCFEGFESQRRASG